jgi:hypothetical protein
MKKTFSIYREKIIFPNDERIIFLIGLFVVKFPIFIIDCTFIRLCIYIRTIAGKLFVCSLSEGKRQARHTKKKMWMKWFGK